MLFPWKIFFKYEGNIGYRKIFKKKTYLRLFVCFVLFCQKNYTNSNTKGGQNSRMGIDYLDFEEPLDIRSSTELVPGAPMHLYDASHPIVRVGS